jgi:type I restriction enzyme S subunit
MSEWKQGKLSEIATIIMGQSPQGETCNNNAIGMPLLNGPTEFSTKYPIAVQFTTDAKRTSYNNDILFCVRGSTTGKMNWSDIEYALGRGLAAIRHKKGILYQYFLRGIIDYNLPILLASATGSTFPNISRTQLEELDILIPSLNEQKGISEILGNIDDKIDLLHRQNKTLEKLAETLFRQWFVEEAEDSWEVKKVKEVCSTITKGTTPTTLGKQFKETGINFIKAESLTDIGGFIPNKFAFIDTETNELLKRSKIQKGDILISIAGTIGRIAYVTEEILPANTNQAIGIMRANQTIISPYFLYCLFNTSEIRNDFEGRVVHAVQPNLSLGEIGDIEFKLPPNEILKFGIENISNLFNKKEKNSNQILTLTQLRDTLLPKLMSGEVRVENI